ncbi:hypothetical protein GQ600_11622 [Phytophthora cactorum]|nr:hypothetical protein GQ600_11622 [Phytophthora cactorum]
MNQHLLWYLGERAFWHFNFAFGSSRIARRAYPVWPTSNLIFTSTSSINCCYPEGNFGGNQLLDGSISLSPLYPSLTIDLHVRIATSFHRVSLASPYSGIVHHLSGTNICAQTQIFHHEGS